MDVCFVGIDVSSKTFNVCIQRDQKLIEWELPNTPKGYTKLLKDLNKYKVAARIGMEATGVYHLNLAFYLSQAKHTEVMIINPFVMHSFAKSIAPRGKSDRKDACMILKYLERMPFELFIPPEQELLDLRSLTRRIEQITVDVRREENRLHAMQSASIVSSFVLAQCKQSISYLKSSITDLQIEMERLIRESSSSKTASQVELLQSIPGIGLKTAIVLISEIGLLPEGLTVKQWVAHIGIDPCQRQSGTSVHTRSRISKRGNKHIRRALFLSAMSASQFSLPISEFKNELVARGKSKKQALVAVMRKLIHCIFGIFKHQTPFDASLFRGRTS